MLLQKGAFETAANILDWPAKANGFCFAKSSPHGEASDDAGVNELPRVNSWCSGHRRVL